MNTPSPSSASPRSVQYHPAPSPSGSYASLMTPSSVSSPGLAPSVTSFGKYPISISSINFFYQY